VLGCSFSRAGKNGLMGFKPGDLVEIAESPSWTTIFITKVSSSPGQTKLEWVNIPRGVLGLVILCGDDSNNSFEEPDISFHECKLLIGDSIYYVQTDLLKKKET